MEPSIIWSIWQKYLDKGYSRKDAAIRAVWCKSIPMARSTFLSILGMMVLGMSSFKPTSYFGMLMASMIFLAFLGDLMLLPALLSYGKKNSTNMKEDSIPEGAVLRLVHHNLEDSESVNTIKNEPKELIATAG